VNGAGWTYVFWAVFLVTGIYGVRHSQYRTPLAYISLIFPPVLFCWAVYGLWRLVVRIKRHWWPDGRGVL
jgi:hypothetical protein